MTTPSGTISMANIATELGIGATGINLNQQNVRRLAGQVSSAVSMRLDTSGNLTVTGNVTTYGSI